MVSRVSICSWYFAFLCHGHHGLRFLFLGCLGLWIFQLIRWRGSWTLRLRALLGAHSNAIFGCFWQLDDRCPHTTWIDMDWWTFAWWYFKKWSKFFLCVAKSLQELNSFSAMFGFVSLTPSLSNDSNGSHTAPGPCHALDGSASRP